MENGGGMHRDSQRSVIVCGGVRYILFILRFLRANIKCRRCAHAAWYIIAELVDEYKIGPFGELFSHGTWAVRIIFGPYLREEHHHEESPREPPNILLAKYLCVFLSRSAARAAYLCGLALVICTWKFSDLCVFARDKSGVAQPKVCEVSNVCVR